MTENHPALSPRLAALHQTLSRGNAAALDFFWQEIEAAGTPFVEAVPGDDAHVLVTFLYRAPLVEGPVGVVCPLAGRGMIQEPMARLLQTPLWYKTYQVRPGLRTEYWFSVDGVTQPDRLNSRLLVFPPDEDALFDPDMVESWFEVPPAEAQSWLQVRPGLPNAHVERVRLRSHILGNERPLSIYTPASFPAAHQPQDLLVLFDRWAYAQVLPTAAMLDQLMTDRSIPPVLVVMVGHPSDATRRTELPCHAPFAEFLAHELLPSQSGSFNWKAEAEQEYEWVARQVVASPRLPLQWYLSVGLLETRPSEGARPNLLLANRHLRDILHAKGYPVHYREFNGGHDLVWQLSILAEGLRVLLGSAA